MQSYTRLKTTKQLYETFPQKQHGQHYVKTNVPYQNPQNIAMKPNAELCVAASMFPP